MKPARPTSSPATTRADTLRWFGLFLVVAQLLTRATLATTTLPAWDLDPTIFPLATPALGPAGSMLIDAVVLLGAAVLFFSERSARRAIHPLWLIALAIGGASILLHGWWWQAIGSNAAHGTLGNQRIGSAWLAAIAAAVAILHAARDAAVRRTIAGVLLAFVVLLTLRGLQQVYIEHPITIKSFETNRERWLAAHGWLPDSPMAQAYIRRLRQPEATGWFALSNVYASFAGLGVAIAAAWLVTLRFRQNPQQSTPPPPPLALLAVLTLVAAGAATALADSKGGYAVAALALAFVATGVLIPDRFPIFRSKLSPLLGPICIFGVLAAVIVRGLIAERIGELSILFRWFYMQASARIFADHAATGVGPDGFQLAYLSAKNPLSPEEVTSPHSIILDWAATLGLAGLAWAALLIAFSLLIGRALLLSTRAHPDTSPPTPNPHTHRLALRAGMLTLAAATITASWIETPYITLDSAIVRMLGLLLGCTVVFGVIRTASTRGINVGLAAGALAMLAHAQIELAGSNVVSCGLFLIALAAAASAALTRAPQSTTRSAPAIAAAAACALAALFLLFAGVVPANRWERDLKAAAAIVEPIADMSERFAELQPDTPAATRDAYFREFGLLVGQTVQPNSASIQAAFEILDARLLPDAAATLLRAQNRFPDEWRVGREASRLYLRLADAAIRRGDAQAAAKFGGDAITSFSRNAKPPRDRARRDANPPRIRARALVWESLYRQGRTPAGLGTAVAQLKEAFQHDPHNLDVAVRLSKLSHELKLPDEARRWAIKALELDALTRLDRGVRGLSSQDRRELEAAAKPVPGG